MYKYSTTECGLFYLKHANHYVAAEVYTALLAAVREKDNLRCSHVSAAIIDLYEVSSITMEGSDKANRYVFKTQFRDLLEQAVDFSVAPDLPVAVVLPADISVRRTFLERVKLFQKEGTERTLYCLTLEDALSGLGLERDKACNPPHFK